MNLKAIVAIAVVAVVIGGSIVVFGVNINDDGGSDDRVTYYGNGGKLDDGETVFDTQLTKVLSCLFTNGTKGFYGWNTKSDATGWWYFDGDSVPLGTILYATWVDYTVESGGFNNYGNDHGIKVPAHINERNLFNGYCGYNTVSDSNKVHLTLFDSTFTNVKFMLYKHMDDGKSKLELSAMKNGYVIIYTLTFTNDTSANPLFKEGSQIVKNNVFTMEIIGNFSTVVHGTQVTSSSD